MRILARFSTIARVDQPVFSPQESKMDTVIPAAKYHNRIDLLTVLGGAIAAGVFLCKR